MHRCIRISLYNLSILRHAYVFRSESHSEIHLIDIGIFSHISQNMIGWLCARHHTVILNIRSKLTYLCLRRRALSPNPGSPLAYIGYTTWQGQTVTLENRPYLYCLLILYWGLLVSNSQQSHTCSKIIFLALLCHEDYYTCLNLRCVQYL